MFLNNQWHPNLYQQNHASHPDIKYAFPKIIFGEIRERGGRFVKGEAGLQPPKG
jgi:hypothetical protein